MESSFQRFLGGAEYLPSTDVPFVFSQTDHLLWPRFLREMLAQEEGTEHKVVTIPKIDLDVGVSLSGHQAPLDLSLPWGVELELTRPTLQRLAMPISAADPYIVCWRSLA